MSVPLSITLAACSVSPETAARQCEETILTTTVISGSASYGVTNEGPGPGPWELQVTTDVFRGTDPYQAYDDCVREKTGQGPVRPLALDP